MNWQDIQKVSPSLTDMWVEICCELLGNESDFFRGRVKQVEWIDGFPRFHLTNLVRFDPLCCSWTPVGQADEPPQLGVFSQTQGEKQKPWFTDPFKGMNGIIQFASLPNQSFSLFPYGTQLPALPVSC